MVDLRSEFQSLPQGFLDPVSGKHLLLVRGRGGLFPNGGGQLSVINCLLDVLTIVGEKVRIISMRKANARERDLYDKYIQNGLGEG